jgi:hypothetical protein
LYSAHSAAIFAGQFERQLPAFRLLRRNLDEVYIMGTYFTPGTLSMGDADAWEPNEGQLLEHYFLRVNQYNQIRDPRCSYLCGRRGTGKSAIARMLVSRQTYDYSHVHLGEVAHYGAYMDVVQALAKANEEGVSVDIEGAVKRLWQWVLPISVMQVIVRAADDNSELENPNIKVMREYLNNSLKPPLHVRSEIGNILSSTFMKYLPLTSSGQLEMTLLELSGTREFHTAIEALSSETFRRKSLIVFDSLESYKIFKQHMIDGFAGVLAAFQGFSTNPEMHGIEVKLFVPAEIYTEISKKSPGKIRNRTVFMRWQAHDLITLLAGRYLLILKSHGTQDDKTQIAYLEELVNAAYEGIGEKELKNKFWYDTRFLPRRVTNRLGLKEDCFAYLLRHSLRRPRDLITGIMQSIINIAGQRGEFPYISEATIVDGVHDGQALQQILGDALSPYEGAIPGDFLHSARAIFQGRKNVMKGRELRQFANELYTLHALPHVEPTKFPLMLIQCGVVGRIDTRWRRGSSPYCKAHFEYMMQGNIALAERDLYCLHPAVADAFLMEPDLDLGVVYPFPEESEDNWLENELQIN